MSARIAVIGAGYAGIAAAVDLVEAGAAVSLFEANRVAGGRARRVEYRGTLLDNGQHLLLGAYTETLGLMRRVGADARGLLRHPLRIEIPGHLSLEAPRLPAPLHLAWALATARGLTGGERAAAARFALGLRLAGFRVEGATTVDQLLAAHRQPARVIALLWGPMCVAALNTPAAEADAQVFVNVLRDALFRGRADSDLLIPIADLSALLPEPAIDWLLQRGCEIALGARVTSLAPARGGWELAWGERRATFDAVVCATAPTQAAALLPAIEPLQPARAALAAFAHEPIATVYLQYAQPVLLPFPMIGLTGGHVHWVFDREALSGTRGLLAAVISASGPHLELEQDVLGTLAHREVSDAMGGLPAPVWTKAITERRATFACRPGTVRPPVRAGAPGLFLAGDYTASPYPATLESAVRSGREAARETIRFLQEPAAHP